MGRFVKGHSPWNKGEWIKKICPACSQEFSVKPSLARVRCCSKSCAQKGKPSPWKGKKASSETRAKQRIAKLGLRGPAHWNWRGGNRPSRKIEMGRDEYIRWRSAVFVRDDFTCQSCGSRGCVLHAHHILTWSSHPDKRFDVGNGMTLCVSCHWRTESFPKKLVPKEMRN